MELLLNATWVLLAFALLRNAVSRRDRRAIAATLCIAALLFPIISTSDDASKIGQGADPLPAILSALACGFALVALASHRGECALVQVRAASPHSDPRSPPLA